MKTDYLTTDENVDDIRPADGYTPETATNTAIIKIARYMESLPGPLQWPELQVLFVLDDNPGILHNEAAKVLGQTPGAFTHMVARTSGGEKIRTLRDIVSYIARGSCSDDRRKKPLLLTPEGKEVVETIRGFMREDC